MKQLLFLTLFSSIFFTSSNCTNSLTDGSKADSAKVEWQLVTNLSDTGARINWKCSGKVMGFLITNGPNYNRLDTSFIAGELHSIGIDNLVSNQTYSYVPTCGITEAGVGLPTSFTTIANRDVIYKRGIWILGGIGSDKNSVREVDLFDPVSNTWYPAITSVPTPRINAQIVSFKNKIYIIGGIVKTGSIYTMSRLVEAYDPFTETWATNLSEIPSALQGGVVGSFNEDIVIIAGTTTTDMTTGTIFNNVFKYSPNVGTGGTWSNFLSSTNIFPRVDMAGCVYDGSLIFTGGRFYNDGLAIATTDAYSPSLNSTSGKIEASISLARHGSAYACYRPISTDRFSSDSSMILIAGGSTGTNISQPVTAITPSNRFEYSILGTAANAFVTGSNLPNNLYLPSMEISYENRSAYLFGGASEFNLPLDSVYSLNMANPGGNPWVQESQVMPRSRFGHKAVILSR